MISGIINGNMEMYSSAPFAMSMDDVVISIFVNGPRLSTLPIKVYTQLKTGVTPEINALCTILLAATLVIFIVYSLITKKKK